VLDGVLEQAAGRPRALSALAGCLLLLAGAACGQRPSAASPAQLFADVARPIVLAHRGGAGEGPESTLAVMREVLARDPAVGIELDVRRTRDGHIVVIHDGSVDRTTNGRGRVEELTLAELQALDAGHCATPGRGAGTARRGTCGGAAQFPWRGRGARIPTLAEVLAALPRRTLVGIEVKTGGFEEPLARLLRASGRLDRVMVGAADGDVAGRLRALLPEAAHYFPRWAATRLALAAKLSGGRLARPEHQVLAVPPEGAGLSLDTPSVLATAHARGVLVAYWTIDDEAEMERLLRLGADALITNYPGRARAVIARLRAAGALPQP
jgi:glycerophosphoryl diester phosphodiesterase